MMIFNYESKKQMKENIGKSLKYTETSVFGNQYKSNGKLVGSNRPWNTKGTGTREFFAGVTMVDGLISKVE